MIQEKIGRRIKCECELIRS